MKKSHRDNEKKRDRVPYGTEERDDVPPLTACISTIQEAVDISLNDKPASLPDCGVFNYARAIKAFEITNNRRLPQSELKAAFLVWWHEAKAVLPADAGYEEWLYTFLHAYELVRTPLGADYLKEAISRATSMPYPIESNRFENPGFKRLVAVCYHLQVLSGASPFFISTRDAAQILGVKSQYTAWSILKGFVRDEILTLVSKGTPGRPGVGRSARFRFNSLAINQVKEDATYG